MTLPLALVGAESQVRGMDTFPEPEWVALSPTAPYIRAGVHLSPAELAEALAIPDGLVG